MTLSRRISTWLLWFGNSAFRLSPNLAPALFVFFVIDPLALLVGEHLFPTAATIPTQFLIPSNLVHDIDDGLRCRRLFHDHPYAAGGNAIDLAIQLQRAIAV